MFTEIFKALPEDFQISTGEFIYNSYYEFLYSLAGAKRNSIEINGFRVQYFTAGNVKKPTLVFLHGFSDAKESYLPISILLKDNYHIVVLDLPGFGKSDRPATKYSISQYAKWVNVFLEKLSITDAYFSGNSMGGAILMEIVTRHPERVKAQALLSSAGLVLHSNSLNLYDLYFYGKNLFQIENEDDFNFFLSYLVHNPNRFPLPVRKHLFHKYTVNSVWYTKLLNDLLHDTIHTEELKILHHKNIKNINIETHIIWGKEDKIFPLDIGYELNDMIPNSKMKVYENVGHAPHMEATVELSEYFKNIFR